MQARGIAYGKRRSPQFRGLAVGHYLLSLRASVCGSRSLAWVYDTHRISGHRRLAPCSAKVAYGSRDLGMGSRRVVLGTSRTHNSLPDNKTRITADASTTPFFVKTTSNQSRKERQEQPPVTAI